MAKSGYANESMFTVVEAAEFLGVPAAWLREQAMTMQICCVGYGKDMMFKGSDLQNYNVPREACKTCALGLDDQETGIGCKLGAGGNPSGGGCHQPR